MGPLRVIAGLQIVIIILLCVPQRRRLVALSGIGGFGLAGLAIRRFQASGALAEFYLSVRPALARFGEFRLLLLAGVLVFAVLLAIAYGMDTQQNRAIRAGSKEAFDQYANDLVRKKRMSLEEAVAAATRIRDGKNAK